MESTLQVMPAQCARCGVLFDLRYDLEDLYEERYSAEKPTRKRGTTKLCWKCRE